MAGGDHKPRIVADEREKASGLPQLLHTFGARVDYSLLEIGDYVLAPNAALERKAVRDLISSIFDGRLFEQCTNLASGFSKAFLLVEGNLEEALSTISNPKVVYGALSSVLVNTDVRMLYTPSIQDSALALIVLAEHLVRGRTQRPLVPVKPKKSQELGLQQLYMVAALPGVGETTARRLLEAFGTPRSIFTAPASEMARLPGVGRARAMKILKAINAPFKPLKDRSREQLRLTE